MTPTPTQEPARAGEQNTKAVECGGCAPPVITTTPAQPAVPEGVETQAERIARDLFRMARDCQDHDDGVLLPDECSGDVYDVLKWAAERLSTPRPAAQESAQGAAGIRHSCETDMLSDCPACVADLATPQPESAQGERGAVEDRESLYLHGGCTDSYCRLCAMDRWERKPGMGHAGISPYDKKRTPTGDQNARAVTSHLDAAIDAVSGEHAPLTLNDLRLNGAPAPVAQVGDGDGPPAGWQEVIERARAQLGSAGGVGTAGAHNTQVELAIGGPLIDWIEDELTAIARTQENGHG